MAPQEHDQPNSRKFSLLHGAAVFALVLMSFISMETHAQDENELCPCFNYEEVEAIFLKVMQMTDEEGMSSCQIEDYSVECNAEVVILDQNYTTIAQARVDWFDFDPSRCEYIDTVGNPGVERNISWPHPAPEEAARACYKIISSVIAKLDTSGKCETYP
jgi:hypothetical protein